MSSSTIILADVDEKLIAPLELKFVEEISSKADAQLEIITDVNYFNEYFSSSKVADILIVGESLYSSELLKHNIGNIFVLVENSDLTHVSEIGVTKIFKYTSPNEIYKQVISMSKTDDLIDDNKQTVVTLIYSPAGGTGKTTVALGLCKALSKSFNRVLYINAQQLNTFQYHLSDVQGIANEAIMELGNTSADLFNRLHPYIKNDGFDYLPAFNMALQSYGFDLSVYLKVAVSAKQTNLYDVIVIDTDCSFDKFKTDLITFADKVIILTEQTNSSVFSINMLLKNISYTNSSKYYFICNKYNELKYSALKSSQFKVNDYIENIDNCDELTLDDLAKQADVQKISYLIM